MKPEQYTKDLPAIVPVAIKDNAAWVSLVIDTQDASYIEFKGILGATDIAMALLKVMASDVKTDDNTLGGTPVLIVDATTKPSATDDGKTFAFGVDLIASPYPRYFLLEGTAGDGSAGTFLAAIACLTMKGQQGNTATDRGMLFVQYV